MEKKYSCESCGGNMTFDVKSQTLKCEHCGNEIVIIDEKNVAEHKLTASDLHILKPEQKTSHTMECKGCGALIEVDATVTSVACPYCGADYVLADKQIETIVPDGIAPFQIDKNKAAEILRTWIKKRWLAPGSLKTLCQYDKFQGVYLPYWTFDAQTDCYYTAMGGRDRQVAYKNEKGETQYRTETDWFFTQGRIQYFFDDILVKASSKLKEKLLERIEPFQTQSIPSYSPDYLAGYSSEVFTVDLQTAHGDAIHKIEHELTIMCESDVLRRFDHVRDVRMQVGYSDETFKHVLLPVYATSYRYKEKQYSVLINGQTSEIQGEYPKSPFKIAALVLLGIILAAAAYYLFSHYGDNGNGGSQQAYQYEYSSDIAWNEDMNIHLNTQDQLLLGGYFTEI